MQMTAIGVDVLHAAKDGSWTMTTDPPSFGTPVWGGGVLLSSIVVSPPLLGEYRLVCGAYQRAIPWRLSLLVRHTKKYGKRPPPNLRDSMMCVRQLKAPGYQKTSCVEWKDRLWQPGLLHNDLTWLALSI